MTVQVTGAIAVRPDKVAAIWLRVLPFFGPYILVVGRTLSQFRGSVVVAHSGVLAAKAA